ncbi:hypothetical protein BIY23_02690 [Wolbachia pipientis]|uniref:TolC family protein n=1 Tax=Wolbachia pipientis TaxID=955 RepID=A0A1E7QKI8_WOLPI|nr:TolC family protein [Wolbachia pipientis]OEY86734.1 hypothetical protein BIY23_02690 [Wolbachia pipientis]
MFKLSKLITVIFMLVVGTNCYTTNLSGAINKAITHSAILKSQLYRYKSLEKKYKAHGFANFLPEVGISYPVDKDFNLSRGHFVLTHKFTSGSFSELSKFRYLIKAEEVGFQQLKQQIALEAVKAYVDVLQKTEMLKLREHKEHVALEHLSGMRKRFSLSEVTDTEVSLAKAKFSSSVSERVDANGKLQLAKITYSNLIGEEANDLYEINDFLLPGIPELSECLQLAKNNNLKLRAITYKRKAERNGIITAQSKFLPSLELQLSSGMHSSGMQGPGSKLFKKVDIGMNLAVPIFHRGLDAASVSEAKLGLKKLIYEYYETVKDVEKGVIHAWNTMLTAQAMIKASQEAEKAATLALAGVEKEVELNLKSTTDLLNTEDALFKARSDLVEAKSNYVISIYNLLFMTNSIDYR